MRHSRDELIDRAAREFTHLHEVVSALSDAEWKREVARAETKDAWTVKDVLVHVTYWKSDVARLARREPRSPDARGLKTNAHNHLIYERFRSSTVREVLAWHSDVHQDVLLALQQAPDEWFSGKERSPMWPFELDVHVALHRVEDIEPALAR